MPKFLKFPKMSYSALRIRTENTRFSIRRTEVGSLPSVVAHAGGSYRIVASSGVVMDDDYLTLWRWASIFAVSAISSRIMVKTLGAAARV